MTHAWHDVIPGEHLPGEFTSVIEIPRGSNVKYELDKSSGHLRVDRPQRFSSMCPTLYGFIPQTYCGPEVAELVERRTGMTGIEGDKDPMDVCVLSEKTFAHGSFFLRARPIGGLRMIDGRQADDKIIAVLENDNVWGGVEDVSELPDVLVERLRHYFSTYKLVPGEKPKMVIKEIYNHQHALEVVEAAMEDYNEEYGA